MTEASWISRMADASTMFLHDEALDGLVLGDHHARRLTSHPPDLHASPAIAPAPRPSNLTRSSSQAYVQPSCLMGKQSCFLVTLLPLRASIPLEAQPTLSPFPTLSILGTSLGCMPPVKQRKQFEQHRDTHHSRIRPRTAEIASCK